jgi:hypothetical protein
MNDATPPRSHKIYWLIGVAIVVAALAAGFFMVLPAQLAAQEKAVSAKHKLVNDKLTAVYDSFKRDAFTKADASVGSSKADVKVALDAAKEARSALDANSADMTKFTPWAVLSSNQAYRTATDLDAREEQYVKTARAFLDQYDAFLAYTDKTIDLQAGAEKAVKDMESVSANDTPVQIAAKVDAGAAQLQTLADRAKTLTAPAFLKADNDQELALIDQLITQLKNISAATRKLDVGKLTAAEAELNRLAADGDRLGQASIIKLQRDSPLQKAIDDLRGLNNQIGQLQTKL